MQVCVLIYRSFNLIEFISIAYRHPSTIKNPAIMTMLLLFSSPTIPHAINPGCGPSNRPIITVVNAPRSGECFHSYSRRNTNRSEERFGDRGTARRLGIPDACVTTGPDETQDQMWFPNETASPRRATSTKPRSGHVPHPALAPPSAIYGGSCEFMCAQGDVYGSRVPTHGV